jgi:hypothetical protein
LKSSSNENDRNSLAATLLDSKDGSQEKISIADQGAKLANFTMKSREGNRKKQARGERSNCTSGLGLLT